jgi:predicted metal-binding membrane protein
MDAPWLRAAFERIAETARRREVAIGLAAAGGLLVAAWATSRMLSRRSDGAGAGAGGTRTATASRSGGAGVSRAVPAAVAAEEAAHDKLIASDFVDGDALGVTLDDVGGLEAQIREIEELILLP